MRFIDRVKEKLLENNKESITAVQNKISRLNEKIAEYDKKLNDLQSKLDGLAEEKKNIEGSCIEKEKFEDLNIIYEFVKNYSKISEIEYIIEKFALDIFNSESIKNESNPILARKQIADILHTTNQRIEEILMMNIDDLKKEDVSSQKSGKVLKKVFFSKVFKRKSKDVAMPNIFLDYKDTLNAYRDIIEKIGNDLIDEEKTAKNILYFLRIFQNIQQRGGKLEVTEKDFFEREQPSEYWEEVIKYHSNISKILPIIEKFQANFERYVQVYGDSPEIFELENLEGILYAETDRRIRLKDINKEIKSINKDYLNVQQDKEARIKEKNKKIQERENLQKESEKIEKAENLNSLGYKDREDAAKKLSLETKNYIVIPIPNNIVHIEELFLERKQIKISAGGITFFTEYMNETATGNINFISSKENARAVLMIPVNGLKKENIESVSNTEIKVNASVLNLKDIFIIMPEGEEIKLDDFKIRIQTYSNGSVDEQVKIFLGDSFEDVACATKDYSNLREAPKFSKESEKRKIDAIINSLFENLKTGQLPKDTFFVDDQPYFLKTSEKKYIRGYHKKQQMDEEKICAISESINNYLSEEGKDLIRIDQFYQDLLLEYLRVNKKAKEEYLGESDTVVFIKRKKNKYQTTITI